MNKKISQIGIGTSEWIFLNDSGNEAFTIMVNPNGNTVTVEATISPDIVGALDVVPPEDISSISNMVGVTTKNIYFIQSPLKAIRINQTTGSGTSTLTIYQKEQ